MEHMNQIYQSIIEFHYGIHFDLGHKYEQVLNVFTVVRALIRLELFYFY